MNIEKHKHIIMPDPIKVKFLRSQLTTEVGVTITLYFREWKKVVIVIICAQVITGDLG